jgi:hypothetical protein
MCIYLFIYVWSDTPELHILALGIRPPLAVAGGKLILEDGSEIHDEENTEDEHGDDMGSGLPA